jgi:preprotein translocase subunit SecE
MSAGAGFAGTGAGTSVARQTRAERRARREARERSMGGSARNADGQAAVRPALQPAPSQTAGRSESRWAGNFIRESIGELRKVEWPTQSHLIQGTVVVIVACAVMGTYLYFVDQIFNKLVSKVLLGQ